EPLNRHPISLVGAGCPETHPKPQSIRPVQTPQVTLGAALSSRFAESTIVTPIRVRNTRPKDQRPKKKATAMTNDVKLRSCCRSDGGVVGHQSDYYLNGNLPRSKRARFQSKASRAPILVCS